MQKYNFRLKFHIHTMQKYNFRLKFYFYTD